jgi:hypothetical protein
MKKQFKFAVAIENYTKETIDFCKELGYEVTVYEVSKFDENNFYYEYLINDHGRVNGAVTNIHYLSGQTLCNWETEKELCKALLAATEGNKVYKDEYYLFQNETIEKCHQNYIYPKIENKPTLEQLLTHFRNKPMEKKIIGYECPMDLYGGRIKRGDVINHLNTLDNEKKCIKIGSSIIHDYLPLELVLTWKPIYDEDKLFLDDQKTIEIEVINRDAIRFDCVIYDKYVFDKICILSELQGLDIYIHNKKVSLEKLEKIKEMLNK